MATRSSVAAICIMLGLAFGVTRFGFSAATAAHQNPAAQEIRQPQEPNMPGMMKMHEQMMAEMTAGDAKLDALVKDMNSATGEAKVATIAAIVNELVQQHKALHGRMAEMHQHMMGGRGMMMRK